MKDPNDTETIDWVNVAQDAAPVQVTPELAVALNNIINRTLIGASLQDLLAEYND